MTEISIGSLNDSFTIRNFSPEIKRIQIKNIDEIIKDYPIRCATCWRIPKFYGDFEKDYFFTQCDKQHKNEYYSFESFFENTNKDFDSLLCYECKNENVDNSKFYFCNKCNLSLCLDCQKKHEQDTSHYNFIEINKIDTFCANHNEAYQYYDSIDKLNLCKKCIAQNEQKNNFLKTSKFINYKETLNYHIIKIKENIKIWNNISSLANEWLKDIIEKLNIFINSINNYIILQQKIIFYLSDKNNFEKYENNFNVFFNYEIINNDYIDKYIKDINNNLNKNYNNNDDFFSKSNFFINLLNKFLKKDNKIELKRKFVLKKEKKVNQRINYLDENNNNLRIENMIENKYELKSKVNCLIPFKEKQFIILGFDTGKIKIFEEYKKERENNFNLVIKLTIKDFENPIKNICELDNDLIIASDIKNNLKIIQINNNFSSYYVIQNLDEIKKNINNIESLPIFSYYKNRHYFCIGYDEHISIYKSNKMPKNLKPPAIGYHDKPEEYSIVQPSFIYNDNENLCFKEFNQKNENNNKSLTFEIINTKELNTLIGCISEVNEKFFATTCPKINSIKFFDMHNDFKEYINIPTINSCIGKKSICISNDRSILLVGCIDGISVISMKSLKKINEIHLRQSILSLDFLNEDCIVCISLKEEESFTKQYLFKKDYKQITKLSQKKIYSKNEVNLIKVIKEKIFYLDDTNIVHFYQ